MAGMGLYNASAAYRELGGILRRARENAGLTAAEVGRRLRWPSTMISRMELGKRDSTTTDVVQYLVACGLTLRDADPILDLTRLAERHQGYWMSDKRIGNSLQSLIFHESSANHSIVYEPQLIPGLLQTSDYARAVMAAIEPSLAEEDVAGTIRTREERQRILYWENPARFTFYVHEQALRLRVGSVAMMHEQLLHLVLTAALDNVAVRIVSRAARKRAAIGGPFQLMEFDEHAPLVYLDHPGGSGLFLEDRNFVEDHYRLLPMLADMSLDEGQSREFAANLADAYDRGGLPDVAHHLAEEQLQRHVGKLVRGGGVAQEQLQRRVGKLVRGSWVAEPATPIYE